jgi:hypothetical protein
MGPVPAALGGVGVGGVKIAGNRGPSELCGKPLSGV